MKQLKIILLLTLTFLCSVSYSQTLDEIITLHVEAVGGSDAWRKVISIKEEGILITQGAEVNISRTILQQKGSRQDVSVAGMNGFMIITPVAGWNFMPFNGQAQPEAMTAEDVKENQTELDAWDELIDYKEKGTTIEYAGKDDVEGTECFKLLLTFKSGKTTTLFLDPKSYLTIRQVAKQKANGQEMDVITNFSNYQKLPEGIVIAMSLTLPFGELNIKKVEVNKPIDEEIFKLPK